VNPADWIPHTGRTRSVHRAAWVEQHHDPAEALGSRNYCDELRGLAV